MYIYILDLKKYYNIIIWIKNYIKLNILDY